MSAEDTVNAIITNGRAEAERALDKATGYTDQAQTAASTVITGLPSIPTPDEPDVVIPPFTPHQDLSAEFTNAFDNAMGEFGPDLRTEFERFLATYYPDFADCLMEHVDSWICNTLENGGTGMNAAVENAIWQRSREREALQARQQKSTLTRAWAGRGFSLPPGVLIEQVAMVDQDLANKVSTHSRDVAIKQAEIEIENVRLAVQQGVQLRISVMNAAVSYVQVFMRPWELAVEKAKALVDAKTRLWQSSAAYYNALIAAERLHLDYDALRIDRATNIAKLTVEQILGAVHERVHAAISAADALGQVAASALGAQVSLGQLAHQTIEED